MTALLRLSAGWIVWAAGFCATYALHGIGCASDWPVRSFAGLDLHRLSMLLAWSGTIALNIGVAMRLSAGRSDTLDRAAAMTNWAAVAATGVSVLPVLAIGSCV